MKKNWFLAAVMFFASFALMAKDKTETNLTPDQVEAKYTAAIEGRTADILKTLALSDTSTAAKVREVLLANYRALNAWHAENDAKLKALQADTNAVAQIRATLKARHEKFLAALAENLSAQQIEQVKDKLTYGKVQFTFVGYLAQYPGLSDAQKAEILRLLKAAREEGMDGGSAAEKTAVFQKCKGRINNYLSKQGLHPEKQAAIGRPETNSPAQ